MYRSVLTFNIPPPAPPGHNYPGHLTIIFLFTIPCPRRGKFVPDFSFCLLKFVSGFISWFLGVEEYFKDRILPF